MADRFVELKISDVDQLTTEDVQDATSGEHMVNGWNSTNTSENMLDQMRTANDPPHAIGRCTVDNFGSNSSHLMDHVNDKISHGMVDRDKATVEDTIGTLSDNVVDCGKTPLNDHPLGTGMVDRRQSTVDSSASNLMDYVIHCEKKKADKMSSVCSGMVDRNKVTVEDLIGTKNDHVVNGEQSMPVKDPCLSGRLVDCDKDTVEDITSNSSDCLINSEQTMPVKDLRLSGRVVARNKATVKDTTRKSSEHIVDRGKSTVHEEPQPSGSVVDHSEDIVAASHTPADHHVVAREKITVENSQSGIAGNIVDREKRTVEDPASSAEAPGLNINHHDRTQLTSLQNNHLGTRQGGNNSLPEAAAGDKWLVQLHVDNASGEEIMNHLPTSPQCFDWNKQVVFGRGGSVDVFINDDHASREHVQLIGQILPNSQVLFMTRNISRSQGYNLNGENITDKKLWTPLHKGDQIKIAKLVVVVDIMPGRVNMQNFVLELKLPQISNNTVVSSPAMPYPISPHSGIDEQGFYNQYPMPADFQSYGPFVAPTRAAGPGHYIPSHTPWLSALGGNMPPAGYSSYISNDMVERLLLQYRGREGYVNITILRHLAVEAVGEWRELGRALGLEDWQLTMIDMDHPRAGEKSYQMLKTWVSMNPENATRVNLKTALEDITVGRGDLVVKYCNTSGGGDNVNILESQNDGEAN